MNKKVFKTMIALVVIFLCACYVLKIFFPEQFVLAIENGAFIKIGTYINAHTWADYVFGICTSFITYWFYLCAVCKRWYLKWWECLIVLAVVGANIGLSFVDINIYSSFSVATFVILPFIFKSELKNVAIAFPIHSFSQTLTLTIRNFPVYMTHINSFSIYLVGIESFLWLVLLYLAFNYKDKKKEV